MDNYLEFGLLAITSLFTMINPLGTIPIFISMTSGLNSSDIKKTAYKSVLIAGGTLILFAIAGKAIFDFFAISVHGLRVVGGVLFFMTGYDMLQARLIRTKTDNESSRQYSNDIAITPLAIPMISGPGAITISIVLFNDAPEFIHKIILFSVIIFLMVITLFFLLSAGRINRFLGENGNKVLMRIMGLIVMVIAVEFLFSGLKPIIRDILNIPN